MEPEELQATMAELARACRALAEQIQLSRNDHAELLEALGAREPEKKKASKHRKS